MDSVPPVARLYGILQPLARLRDVDGVPDAGALLHSAGHNRFYNPPDDGRHGVEHRGHAGKHDAPQHFAASYRMDVAGCLVLRAGKWRRAETHKLPLADAHGPHPGYFLRHHLI